jgi:hypothetical protein
MMVPHAMLRTGNTAMIGKMANVQINGSPVIGTMPFSAGMAQLYRTLQRYMITPKMFVMRSTRSNLLNLVVSSLGIGQIY